MRRKNWLSGLLAAAICVNVFSVGALAAEPVQPRSTDTQSASAEETVYVNSYNGSDRSILFDENWKFNLGEANGAEAPTYNDSAWRTVDLPHDYSIEQEYTTSGEAESGYLPGGTGWYRKSFTVSSTWADRRVSIDFGGVYMNATVYLNGEQLGTHPYGYTPFSFELPADKLKYNGENVIAVKVENKIPSSRWYSGSGIYRSVHLTVTDPVHVARYGTTVTTTNAGAVTVKTQVQNNGANAVSVTVQNKIYESGGTEPVATGAASTAVSIDAGVVQEITDSSITVSSPKIWSLDAPNMYFVRTEVSVDGQVVDTYDTDFGFREFAFDANTGFSLNGEKMKLKGMCMHHDQGALGSAAWCRATERQVEILKGMGCNAIRVTHNPASDELIDICNKKGMLLIEEIFDGWHEHKNGNLNDYATWFNQKIGANNAIVGGATDMQWAQFDLQETIRRGRNSPAIIAWSLGNEVQEGAGGLNQTYVDNAKKLLNWGKTVDSTRPFTTGDNQRGGNQYSVAISNLLADAGGLIGYNYANTGAIENAHNNHSKWVMYGSETASAVNSRGVYDHKGSQADKDGNRKLTSYDKSAVGWGATASDAWWRTITQDFNAGEFVWTGFDYIGEPTPWNGTGAGAIGKWPSPKSSYFGVVDTNGLPKDSYYFYQSQWRDDVHTLHVLPTWDETDVVKDGNNVEVVVYSDAPVVKLFLNGTEVGMAASTETTTSAGHKYRTFTSGTGHYVQKSGHESLYATFNVPYEAGTLTAKAYEAGGTKEITGTEGRAMVKTTSGASKLTASADRAEIAADGRDLSYVTIDVTDASGNIVNGAENEITVSVSGNGTLVGLDNGVQADHTSYQSSKRKAGAGRLVAIVQSTKNAGSFSLTASANGLTSASVTVTTTPVSSSSESGEKRIVSYQISKNYYVKLGNAPVLPQIIQVNYSDGTQENVSVQWDTYDSALLNTVGSFPVRGALGNTGITTTVNINMLDNVAALLNYSAATPVGSKPILPASRPAIMADGTVLSAEFPVAWTMPENSAFNAAGTVTVSGTASVFGQSIDVKSFIRVAEGGIIPGGNVASQAVELCLGAHGTQPDGLENIRDGNDATAWTGTGDILFRYDTAQNLNKIKLTFQNEVPDGVSCAWSGDGNTYTPISVQPTSSGLTATYDLGGLVSAVWVKITLPQSTLAEAELMVGTPDFPVNSSAELTGLTVNGKQIDAASLAAKNYPTQALLVKDLGVESAHNASYTVLPAYENMVKIQTESEDHSARAVYQISLGAKTNGQPLTADDASRDYDHSKTTATAGNERSEQPASHVVDDRPDTLWHTPWNVTTPVENRWIQLQLETPQTVNEVRYLPRASGGNNGRFHDYKVEVSSNGTQWTKVATGSWNDDAQWKIASFDAVECNYVRLTGLTTYGSTAGEINMYGSAAEVRVRTAEPKTDLSTATVTINKPYDWIGSPIVPAPEDVTVVLNGTPLKYGIDYKLRAENNTDVGTATLYVDGIVDYTGTVSQTFTINAVTTSVTGFEALDEVVTLNGVAPTLPGTVSAKMNVGPNVEKAVEWPVLSPSQYTDPESKTFTVEGMVAGTDLKPSLTVRIVKGVSAENFSSFMIANTVSVLPKTVTVHFDDGIDRQMSVTWDAFAGDTAGIFTVNGTVTAGKDKLPVTATVRVVEGTPTNVALHTRNALPKAFSSHCPNNGGSKDSPANVIDGKKDFTNITGGTGDNAKEVWSDWESGTYHTAPWVGVLLGDDSGIKPSLVSKVSIGFFDEKKGDTNGNAVRVPAVYDVQYYDGPAFDYSGDPKVVSEWPDSPLNVAENWKTVTYIGEKPAVPAGANATSMTEVNIQPVVASFFRVVMTPQPNQWVGAVELEIYGVDVADKTALDTAIAAANTAKSGISTSDRTAAEVEKGVKFVTTSEMKALTDAITAANTVKNKDAVTQDEVDEAVTMLNAAVTTFSAAIKTGTKEDTPSATAPGITTESLTGGTVGKQYTATLAADGTTPITWSVSEGRLPNGLTLTGDTISGTPTTVGTFNFTVKAENTTGEDTQALSITIDSPTATYTITFDTNGGNVLTPNTAQTGTDGKLSSLPTPTRSGRYSFAGWYTAASGGTQVTLDNVFTSNTEIFAHWNYTGGSSSGGSHSSNTTTTTTTKPDGSKVTTTVNKSTGETTVTTASPDGVKVQMVTKGDTVVDASVTIPKDAIEASTVELPAELPTTDDQHKAPAIKIKLPQGTDAVKVEVPVDGLTDGTVAVLVKPDGTEQVIRRSVTEDGKLVVPLDGSATVKIVDKGASFRDVPQDSWAAGPIAYATSRELFKGMGNGRFGPDAAMTRAMMASVLYRFYGEPAPSTSVRYSDVETDRYYADAVAWLSEQGIVSGANGKYLPEESVTREQLMAMLYRAAGSPAIKQGGLDRFADGQAVSAWARDAAAWAVDNGIVKGVSGNRLAPQKAVSRAEAAAMLQRFAAKL